MPGLGIGNAIVPFKRGGVSWNSYWTSRSDYWYKEGTRNGLMLPNGINPGTDDASILLPLVEANCTLADSKKIDSGITPVQNTVIVLKGRSLVNNADHAIGLQTNTSKNFYFGVAAATFKWEVGWANKSAVSSVISDTDYHVFVIYNGNAWIRPATTELTDASILNVINNIAADCICVTPTWAALDRTFWYGSFNASYNYVGKFAYSDSYIGTITAGVITWQKKFIFNDIFYAYDTLIAGGSVAWTVKAGNLTLTKTYVSDGSDYCLNYGHTLLRINSTEKYVSIPYLVSGVANHTITNPTGYETIGDFDGDTTGLNYTDCKIRHSIAFWDRSNITTWADAARAVSTYYDVGNVKDFHITEHNYNKFAVWLNSGYEGRAFIKTNSNSMDYYLWTKITEIIACTLNQTGNAFTKAMTYSGDNTLWNYSIWNKSTFGLTDIQGILNKFPLTTGQTDDISFFGSYGTGTYKWGTCVLTPNGKIITIPSTAVNALVIDTLDDSVQQIVTRVDNLKWLSGVLAPNNGCVYMIPLNFDYIGKIDPTINSYSLLAGGITHVASNYGSAVVAQNGMIYCVPYNGDVILKINPITDTWSEFDSTKTIDAKWGKGILAPNGYIYFIPSSETAICKLNPTDDSLTFFGNIAGAYKWESGTITKDGIIYAMPYNDTRILKIDTNTDTISYIATTTSPTAESYGETIKGGNGMIYGLPFRGSQFIKLDPSNDSVSYFGSVTGDLHRGYGAVLAPNGSIYMAPYLNNDSILKLLSPYAIDKNIGLSRVLNGK